MAAFPLWICGALPKVYPLPFRAGSCSRLPELSRKGTNHGYGALALNLSRDNCLWRLGCRRDDRCRMAVGLDAHGTTSRHSRIDQPLWFGSLG